MPELSSPSTAGTASQDVLSTIPRLEHRLKEVVCLTPLSWDFVPACFLDSLVQMFEYAHNKYSLKMVAIRSPYLDSLRDLLVDKALTGQPDYILWLDADQRYPAETPEKLMRHVDDGKLVVGGVTPHRATGQPMIYDWLEPDKEDHRMFQYRSKNNYLSGIQQVGGMGMGGVMVHPKVYRELLQKPFFQMSYSPSKGRTSGEDVVFYRHCHDAGIDVWCDYDLYYKHHTMIEIGIRWQKDEEKAN